MGMKPVIDKSGRAAPHAGPSRVDPLSEALLGR